MDATKPNARAQGWDSRVAWEIIQEDQYFPCGAKPGAAMLSWSKTKSWPNANPQELWGTGPFPCSVLSDVLEWQRYCHLSAQGVPLPFSAHFNSNTHLPQFFLLYYLLPLSCLVLMVFGLADTKAEVSTWKRSPSAAKEDGNMKTDGRAHGNDGVLDLQQQCWLQDLTCSALNSLSYLKNQIAPFIPAGWQLRVSVDSPLWFLTSPWYPRHL